MVEVNLKRVSGYKFEATNSLGKSAIIDGPAKIGGDDDGVRPMEMLLMGLAGCASFDLVHILKKGRDEVGDVDVKVNAERSDEIPSVFTKIHLHFKVDGSFTEKKLQRALQLSVEKYCSVGAMLGKVADITYDYEFKASG